MRYRTKKAPTFFRKSPTFLSKSPTFSQKTPTFLQTSPTYLGDLRRKQVEKDGIYSTPIKACTAPLGKLEHNYDTTMASYIRPKTLDIFMRTFKNEVQQCIRF